MLKEKILRIRITDRCNLNCSFCSEKRRLANPAKEDEKLVLNYLKENPYKRYGLVGGEPFLKFDFLKEVVSILPKDSLKMIHTNATFLNEEIVSWINKNKIFLYVSLNGVDNGEKNFNELTKKSNFKGDLANLINKVNSLSIKKVILKGESKEDILLSIVSLHKTFPNAKIEAMFDWWKTEEINVKDFLNIEFVLICLKKFDSAFATWFEMPLAPCGMMCEGCNAFGINPDGSTFLCDFDDAGFKKLSREQEELLKKIRERYLPKKEVNFQ